METNQSGISIFNIGEHQEELNSQMFKGGYETKLFNPKLQNAQDSMTFIIRPVPYIFDPINSLLQRAYYVLQDIAGNNVFFDSMTTFNKPAQGHYEFCPVSDLWSKLRQSNDPAVQKRADFLRLQRANYAYVLIVNYPKDPTLNGKIVPMQLPVEIIKSFNKMANPSKDDLALGIKPIQPFDIINGCNIKCEVSGKIVNNTLMRDWAISVGNPSVLELPLGVNGANVPINTIAQNLVEDYFKEHQTEVLTEMYGYKEPTIEVKRRMKAVLANLVQDLPGLPMVVAEYFPELNLHVTTDQDVQPQAQAINMNAAGPVQGFMGQPAPQPVAHQEQPQAQPVVNQVQPVAPIQPEATQPMQPIQQTVPPVQPEQNQSPATQPMQTGPATPPQSQPQVIPQQPIAAPQEQVAQQTEPIANTAPPVNTEPAVNAAPAVNVQPQQPAPTTIGGIVIP